MGGLYGIYGNETVDALAKKGADSELIGPEPFCGISITTVRTGIKQLINDLSRKHYTDADEQKMSSRLINLSRRKLRVMTMFLTGHGVFKSRLN